jgi:hypothetical protein
MHLISLKCSFLLVLPEEGQELTLKTIHPKMHHLVNVVIETSIFIE